MAVEKILARFHPTEDSDGDLYLVKFKYFSYLHTRIVPEEVILRDGSSGKGRLQRFLQHNPVHYVVGENRAFFPVAYKGIDRLLAAQASSDTEYGDMEYLVKWNQLPHGSATWEFLNDLKDSNGEEVVSQKINQFIRFNSQPIRSPEALDLMRWTPLKQSPVFKTPQQKLHPWKIEGINWLLFNVFHGRGCILADEMGLGKTLQTICTLDYLSTNFGWKPFLIIAPVSTLPHWKREIESWTNINVVVFHGTKADREIIRLYEWAYWDARGAEVKGVAKFDVLLCSYEMVLAESSLLGEFKWSVMVVDEAHRLKNWKSKLNTVVRQSFSYKHCILLTGTPIQNGLDELWSLLNIASPKEFSITNRTRFLAEFGGEERASDKLNNEDINKLQEMLKPYLLRRLKEEVAGNSIPPKEETIIECELTSTQKQYYRAVYERNRSFLYAGCKSNNVPQLLNVAMQLRKVCNHPFLLEGVETKLLQEKKAVTPEQVLDAYVQSSGKMVLLDKLLPKLQEGGHKVLIFSQLKMMLDVIEFYLQLRGITSERIDGDTSAAKRQAAIDRFSSPDSQTFVFLLCTRAGGVGINLAAADTVVIYDSDWNPQNDLQAQARAHRIGQTNMVKVYRLITAKTYEKQMFMKASLKLGLDQAVLSNLTESSSSNSDVSKKLSGEEIDQLLKFGAYDLLADEEASEAASQSFCDQDIDEILAQRSTVLTIPGSNNTGGENGFSKATFVVSDGSEAVDINASDFWEKILPDTDSIAYLTKVSSEAMDSGAFNQSFFQKLNVHVAAAIEPSIAYQTKADTLNLLRLIGRSLYITDPQRSQIYHWVDQIENPRRKTRKKETSTADQAGGDDEKEFVQEDENWTDSADFNSMASSDEDAFRLNLRDSIISYVGSGRYDSAAWAEAMKMADRIGSQSNLTPRNCVVTDVQKFALKMFIGLHKASDFEAHIKLFQDIIDAIKKEVSSADLSMSYKDPVFKVSESWMNLNITRSAKRWASICRLGQRARYEIQLIEENPDMHIDISDVTVSAEVILPSWWQNDHDWKLIRGIAKYGGHPRCFVYMSNDPEIGFGQASQSSDWPLVKYLESRARSVLDSISRQRFYEMRRLDKVRRETKREETLKARQEKVESLWTKKEKKSFQRLLHVYGQFRLNRIKELGDFSNKSVDKLADYYPKYYLQCLYMCRTGWTPSGEGGSAAAILAAPDEILRECHLEEHSYCTCQKPALVGLSEMVCCRSCMNWHHSKCIEYFESENSGEIWVCNACKIAGTVFIHYKPLRLRHTARNPLPMSYRDACYKILRELSDRMDISVIRVNVENGAYETLVDFAEDVRLSLRNFNALQRCSVSAAKVDSHEIFDLSDDFEDTYDDLLAQLAKPEIVDQYVSQKMAKKTMERVEIFQKLMEVIQDPTNLYARICVLVTKIDPGLPPFWVPVIHDTVLLYAIHFYGFGDISGPLSDSFILEMLQRQKDVSVDIQIAYLREMLEDRSPLSRRLIYVLDSLTGTVMEFGSGDGDDDFPSAPSAATSSFPSQESLVGHSTSSPPHSNLGSESESTRASSSGAPGMTARQLAAQTSKSNNKGTLNRDIKRDDNGNIIYPVLARGGATIWSLGTVVYDRKKFHSKHYIWPVGFRSNRFHFSYLKPDDRVEYISEIKDGGDCPMFSVIAADDPANAISNVSATGAWTLMMQRIYDAKSIRRQNKISVSGPEMFGFSDVKVKKLIEELPNANACKTYISVMRK
jgi:superfamily II DNA or RNA helicase